MILTSLQVKEEKLSFAAGVMGNETVGWIIGSNYITMPE